MNFDTRLDELGDRLERSVAANLPNADLGRPRARRTRPRLLAGGTLGLAGVGVGLVLALSGSTAPPAFAITRTGDGSVLVHLDNVEAVPAAERQLAAMGINEWFEPALIPGTATGDGTVTCTVPTAAQAASVSNATHRTASGVPAGGPTVRVLLGTNGTEQLPAGQAGPTQPNGGPVHLSCFLYSGAFPGDGNTGTGNTGTS